MAGIARAAATATICLRWLQIVGSSKTMSAPVRPREAASNARSISSALRASNRCSSIPTSRAAVCVSSMNTVLTGLSGFISTLIRESLPRASMSSSTRFPLNSGVRRLNPVTFPPGRAKLATRPALTGSPTATITIGMVLVAAFAARLAGVAAATITSTRSRTSSATSSGSRSCRPSAQRGSSAMLSPST